MAALPATSATGIIRGHVFNAEGRPLPRAQVALFFNDTATTETDEDGRYEFVDVRAGSYLVTASRSGFATLAFGQKRPLEPGAPFSIAAGEIRERVDITLPRRSAIVGRIVDENGDPLEGVNVSVLKASFIQGRRQLVGAASRKTDDRGHFRVYGLQPGLYVVRADVGQVGSQDLPGYAATYFPGTPNPAEAQTVTVGIAQEVADVDVSLAPVRTARVAGRTLASDGQPFQGGLEMRVSRRSSAVASESFGARTERDGTFEFPNVPPGEYVMAAFRGNEVGWQFVTVNGEDVTGLVVQTTTGSTVSGRITFDGSNSPSRQNMEISPIPADPDLVPFKGTATHTEMRDDWTFEIIGVNGLARLRAVRIPAAWALKAILVNGADATDTPLSFGTKEQSLKDVEVVLTSQLTQVVGAVTEPSGRPLATYAVLVFSTDRDRWYNGSRFFALAGLRPDGSFLVSGLPPGDYFAAAMDWLQPDEATGGWQDPAFLDSVARRATKLTLTEGQKLPVSLKLIPR